MLSAPPGAPAGLVKGHGSLARGAKSCMPQIVAWHRFGMRQQHSIDGGIAELPSINLMAIPARVCSVLPMLPAGTENDAEMDGCQNQEEARRVCRLTQRWLHWALRWE